MTEASLLRTAWRLPRFFSFLLIALAGLLGACGEKRPRADLVFIADSPHNQRDPQKMSWAHDIRLTNQLFEGLVRLDYTDMSVRPGVAERWEISEDGTTYRFHLRADARWSNGDPVTAGDFAYAWFRALSPDGGAQYVQLFHVLRGAETYYAWRAEQLKIYAEIARRGSGGKTDPAEAAWQLAEDQFARTVGVKVVDDRTLEVVLNHPTPYFLELTAFVTFFPNHRASLKATEQADAASGMVTTDSTYWADPQRLITNGPYHLVHAAFRRSNYLEQNPHYWNRAAMANTSIEERIIENPQTALQAYENGDADVWASPPTAGPLVAGLVASGRKDLHLQPAAGTYFYNFNCRAQLPDGRKNPFADARVRRAFALAIDRQAIVERVTRLNQPIARSYIPPQVIAGYQPPVDAAVLFEPQAAATLLAEAGYPGGAGIGSLTLLYNTGAQHEFIAQAVQAMWKQHLGVDVRLEGVEVTVFGDRIRSGQFDIARAAWFGDYPDPTTWLEKMGTGAGNNDCGWSDPTFDALLQQARSIREPEARMAVLAEAERIIQEQQPMALIFQYVMPSLFDAEKVTGLQPNAWARWDFSTAAVQR